VLKCAWRSSCGILLLFGGGEAVRSGSVALALLFGILSCDVVLTVVVWATSHLELFVMSSLVLHVMGYDESGREEPIVVGSNIFNMMVECWLQRRDPARCGCRAGLRSAVTLRILLAVSIGGVRHGLGRGGSSGRRCGLC